MEHLALLFALAVFAAILWRCATLRARAYETSLQLDAEAWCWLAIPLLTFGCSLPVSYASIATLCVIVGASISAASDRQTGYIFDIIIAGCAFPALATRVLAGSFAEALVGILICGGGLTSLALATRGRGFAWGDVKLGAMIGILGINSGTRAIGIAFVLGAALALFNLIARRIHLGDAVPFAPYLAAGACSAIALGQVS